MSQATDYATEFIQVRDVKTRLLRGGEGPPLLFLHGAGRTGIWLQALEHLAAEFDVLAPDHPGFGQSDRPDWLDGMDDIVFHYLDLLDYLGLDKVNLVGVSFGGWLAAEFAVSYSERIEKLVLSAAAGLQVEKSPITDLFALAPDEMPGYLFANPEKAAAMAAIEPTPEIEQELYRGRYTLAHLGWNPLLCNPALRRRLYRITCPTRILWGADDRLIPPAHGEAYASGIADAELVSFENCGHSVHQEMPEEFAARVAEFLKA